MAITVRLEPERLSAPAGSDVDGVVVVSNPHDEPVHVRLVVSGEIAGWSAIEPGEFLIDAGGHVECHLRFRLPRGAPGGVGDVPFVVRGLSDADGIGGAVAEGWLEVEGQAELALRLVPGSAKGIRVAHLKVAADNLGEVPARAQLLAVAGPDVDIEVEPDSVVIEPRSTAWAKVTVRPRPRHIAGPPKSYDFRVRLEPLGGARVSVEGQMIQRSLVVGYAPRVLAAVVLLVGLVAAALTVGGDDTTTDVAAGPAVTTTVPAPTTTAAPPSTEASAPAEVVPTTVPLADRRIAFQTKRDGNSEIYTARPDGSEPANLSANPAHDSEPAWSPDGTRLAFDSDRNGNFDVYVMNADGTGVIQLTTEPAPDGYPSWSPDGSRIAFISFRDGNSEVYVMNADGTDQVRLTKNVSDDARPTWSPDGTRIAFHTDRDGNYEIYTMAADGTDVKNLSNHPAFDRNPAWAPNGSRLAFDSTRESSKPEIYLMGADGTLPVRLTQNDAIDRWPVWSPDGSRLAFQSDRDDSDLEVFTIGAGGGATVRVTEFPGEDGEPDW